MAEFLLDRGQVRDKEGKEAKFAIVSTIVDHPESMGIFGQVKMAAFRRHVREGPFYVAVQAEVAMEGE
jgi:26S proteasome non-ATPase regulatory subunit 5